MKTVDFFYRSILKNRPILIGLLCCIGLTANAEPPPAETFTQPDELVLTLSDEWLDADANDHHSLNKPKHAQDAALLNRKQESRPANLGCGMDVSDIDSAETSLTSRVVGKCDLNFRY